MIDLPQTIAALERAAISIEDDGPVTATTIRALAAALGQAQEAWQYSERSEVAAWTYQPEPGCYRVLIVPMEEKR